MQVGRFACVALPIILTIGAIISFMIATLSGVAHDSLYIFSVDLENLSINPDLINDFVQNLNIDLPSKRQSSEITAGDLGLGGSYDITLWGYCSNNDGKRECTSPEFDWAHDCIQNDILDKIGSVGNLNIDLPDELNTALDIFSTVTRYTEIAFIVALSVLGLELFIGIFSNCTRIISCLTWLIGIAAIVLCVAAAGLATAMAVVVVSAVEATASEYGVRGSFNGNFLACVWIGAAFAIAASLFWLFTICCCKPERRSKRDRGSVEEGQEKPNGAYLPIGNDHEMTGGHSGADNSYHNQFQPSYGHDYGHAPSYYSSNDNNRSDLAYEPYSHRA